MLSIYQRPMQLHGLLHKSLCKNILSKLNRSVVESNIRQISIFNLKRKEENKLDLIYYGDLTPQIRAVKLFSVTSSFAGLLAQPIIINEASRIGSTPLLVGICSVVGFFTFVTPILLHLLTKRYVTKIHYDPVTSTYEATTINFFLVHVQFKFKPEDVVVPDIPGMFTTMIAKKKPLFIAAKNFTDPQHYVKIMGYDKPLDFKIADEESSAVKK